MTWHKNEFQTQLQHLIKLAKMPGWKEQAWHRAKELDKDQTGLYRGIAEALTAEMSGTAKTQEGVQNENPRNP